MTPCAVEGCDRPAKTRGWCHAHYMRWYNTKVEPTGPVGPAPHPRRPCVVQGCDRLTGIGDLCSPHGKRAARNNGDPGPAVIQKKAGNNKGQERMVQPSGYVFLRRPDHPNAYANGTVQEHTVVMSEMLGRPLVRGENVHHKNGIKSDNRPSNLELWVGVGAQPKGARVADLLAWAREVIKRYGNVPPEILG